MSKALYNDQLRKNKNSQTFYSHLVLQLNEVPKVLATFKVPLKLNNNNVKSS